MAYFPANPDVPSAIWTVYDSPFATYIRESETLFPVLQTFHVVGLILMVGTIFLVDLRIVGAILQTRPAAEVGKALLPYTWAGFAVVFTSGAILLAAQVGRIYENEFLRAKLVLLLFAAVNVIVFHLGSYRRIANWGTEVAPVSAKAAAWLSIALWSAVIITGRYIAYY